MLLDRRNLFLVGDAERRAAAAGRDDVRVVDLEARALQRLDVVDDRPAHVRQARLVDEDLQAGVLEDLVAVALGVEREVVLKAGAAAALDAHAQAGRRDVGTLRRKELMDLLRALVRDGDHARVSRRRFQRIANTPGSVAPRARGLGEFGVRPDGAAPRRVTAAASPWRAGATLWPPAPRRRRG